MRKKKLGIALYVLYLLILLEVSGRAYWSLAHDVPFWRMRDISYVYYPEAATIERSHCGDEGLDVLLLGASVLNRQLSPAIEPLLAAELGALYDQSVCLHNLSRLGHTTLDSFYKFAELSDLSFDLVIVYHGINEVRANNCPSSIYRDDYGHYAWYETINAMTEHAEISYLVFPWTLRYAYLELKHRSYPEAYLPRHVPENHSWIKMGATVKTKDAFRQNMMSILRLARRHGSPVVAMTFAYYLPRGYTRDRFDRGQLGYAEASQAKPVEIWGLPENVVNGIESHNRIIRDIGAGEVGVHLVDQEEAIPKSGRYFVDICHLSLEGQRLFVRNIVRSLEREPGAE